MSLSEIKKEVVKCSNVVFCDFKEEYSKEQKRAEQKEVDKYAIHITTHSGKLTGIPSINTSSLTNPYCIERSKNLKSICSRCYSNTLSKLRKQLEAKLCQNSKVLSESIIPMDKLPIFNNLYVRMSSFGDLINYNHLINLVKIARKNKKTTFALWTKRTELIKRYYQIGDFPPNMIIIYSNPMLDKPMSKIPKGFDKVFQVFSKGTNQKINCGSRDCLTCLKCYKFNNNLIINELVK